MSKVICDVCGTAYPETATHCPICGSAKSMSEQTVAGEAVASGEDTSYTYVKGGRFSKRNVRRRNQKGSRSADRTTTAVKKSQDGDDEQTNIGLIIVVIALLLAIIAVVIYIGVRYFAQTPGADGDSTIGGITQSTGESQDPTDGLPNTIPCTALEISNKTIEFRLSGDAWLLEAVATPENTTDKVTYSSADEKVAIVSDVGCVTAVGGGETIITVTCGDIVQECKIICSFASIQDPTTDATEDATEDATSGPVDADFDFSFRWAEYDEQTGKYDASINDDAPWKTYSSKLTVDPSEITWTSDDPSICTIEDGIVTVVSTGRTEIHAEYGGKTFTCIVRCTAKKNQEQPEDEDVETDTEEETEASDVTISHSDVTIKIGETFYLRLKDANGENIEVAWEAADSAYVSVDGNKITGLQAKLAGVKVSTTYEGTTYSCLVRISG